ncbi:MAG TPA: lysine 2,3-aminomutase, partial [Clostridiaceae bacterium]|nr:lysine 2,3-aminomutase [Clostridiaceae bacterium]
GKIPVMPQYVISQSPTKVVLRNYEGVITTYVEPQYTDEEENNNSKETGVMELLKGDKFSLEPEGL